MQIDQRCKFLKVQFRFAPNEGPELSDAIEVLGNESSERVKKREEARQATGPGRQIINIYSGNTKCNVVGSKLFQFLTDGGFAMTRAMAEGRGGADARMLQLANITLPLSATEPSERIVEFWFHREPKNTIGIEQIRDFEACANWGWSNVLGFVNSVLKDGVKTDAEMTSIRFHRTGQLPKKENRMEGTPLGYGIFTVRNKAVEEKRSNIMKGQNPATEHFGNGFPKDHPFSPRKVLE